MPLTFKQFLSFSMTGSEACFAAVSMCLSLLCELQVMLLWELCRCKTWPAAFWQHTPHYVASSHKKVLRVPQPNHQKTSPLVKDVSVRKVIAGEWKPGPESTPRPCLPASVAEGCLPLLVQRVENCRSSPPSAVPLIFSVTSPLTPYVLHLRCKGLMTPT